MTDDYIKVYRITEARTFANRENPEEAVLKIVAGDDEFHFGMRVDELRVLARLLLTDAKLLAPEPLPEKVQGRRI